MSQSFVQLPQSHSAARLSAGGQSALVVGREGAAPRPRNASYTGPLAGEINRTWHALLDSLCTPCSQPTVLTVPPTHDQGKRPSHTHEVSLCSTNVLSATDSSVSPLTSSTPSMTTRTPRSSRGAGGTHRSMSPMASHGLPDVAIGLPPPLLFAQESHPERTASPDLVEATPSTTTLVPHSALSSVVLGPHPHGSDCSLSGTPAMNAETTTFCLSGEVDEPVEIPPALCSTLAEHGDYGDPIAGAHQLGEDVDGAAPAGTGVPIDPRNHLDGGIHGEMPSQPPLTDLNVGMDSVADRDIAMDGRVTWKPPTFASVNQQADGDERTCWQALVASDGHAPPRQQAQCPGGVRTSTLHASFSAFYDLYHAVNRTNAGNTECEASTPLVEPHLTTPVHVSLPPTVELERIVPRDTLVNPHIVDELCSFVMEDGTTATQRPIAVSVGDHGNDREAGQTTDERTKATPLKSYLVHFDSAFSRRTPSTASVPSMPSAGAPADGLLSGARLTVGAASLATTSVSRASSFCLPQVTAGVLSATDAGNAAHTGPSPTATPVEDRLGKHRGVLSVQNLRAHKARLSVTTVRSPVASGARPTSCLTIDRRSSQPSSGGVAATTHSASRCPITGCLKPTRVLMHTQPVHGSEPIDDAFRKCQFLCLDDVKEAVARTCSEQAAVSPAASVMSPSAEVSCAADSGMGTCADVNGQATALPSAIVCATNGALVSPTFPTTPLTSLAQAAGDASAAPSLEATPHQLTSTIDKDSALMLAAAFTNVHLAPLNASASWSPENVTTPLLRTPHQRDCSSSAVLAVSVPDRMSSANATSLAPMSSSAVCAGTTADVDDRVSVSFSLGLSNRRESYVSHSRARDPLECKVCCDVGNWRDDDDCGLGSGLDTTRPLPAHNTSFSRDSCAFESVHMASVAEIGHITPSYVTAITSASKFDVSQGTAASFSCPFSSANSPQAAPVSLTQLGNHTIVFELNPSEAAHIGEGDHTSDATGACQPRSTRMYCHAFDGELADVSQLEQWAKRCATTQYDSLRLPTVTIATFGVKTSHTEVMT